MKNVNVLLDTGTSPSVVSQEIAHGLRLRGKTASIQTLKGTIQTQIVIVPRIQIGPMDADSVEVVVQDLRFIEQTLGISLWGIAGLDLLSTGSFTIDYPRRKIAFGSIALREREVRFETQVPFLTVNVTIEGQAVLLLVDSRAEGLLVHGGRPTDNAGSPSS